MKGRFLYEGNSSEDLSIADKDEDLTCFEDNTCDTDDKLWDADLTKFALLTVSISDNEVPGVGLEILELWYAPSF